MHDDLGRALDHCEGVVDVFFVYRMWLCVAKLSARTIKPLVEFGREFISSRLIWSRQPAKRLTM